MIRGGDAAAVTTVGSLSGLLKDAGNRFGINPQFRHLRGLPGQTPTDQYRLTHPRASMMTNIVALAGICRLKSTAE